MFQELLDKTSPFYDTYMRSFSSRSANSSVLLESEEQEINDVMTVIAENNYMNAIDWILEIPKERKFSPYDMVDLIQIITNDEYDDFRKSEAIVIGSNIKRSKTESIRSDLYCLLDNYYNVWTDLDVYLKEAMFHINFLLIHPFGDGNGRIARLITSNNLIRCNLAPIVIPKSKKDYYCSLIENKDYTGLAMLFKELSVNEKKNLDALYESFLNNRQRKM